MIKQHAAVRLNREQQEEIIALYKAYFLLAPGEMVRKNTIIAMLDILGWNITENSRGVLKLERQS